MLKYHQYILVREFKYLIIFSICHKLQLDIQLSVKISFKINVHLEQFSGELVINWRFSNCFQDCFYQLAHKIIDNVSLPAINRNFC